MKLAVVTGASGGLGSELCKWLARDGYSLVLVDRNLEKSKAFAARLGSTYPGAVRQCFAIDLADHKNIRETAKEILEAYPRIDCLFNNAGVLTETLQFSRYGNELHFETNSLGSLALIDGLRPGLEAAQGAAIVSTSAGIAGNVKELTLEELTRPKEFAKLFGPYAKSKQALNVLTAALAPELGRDNILIRTADPGPNKTVLTKGAGTPLWMRLFYAFLPSPAKGAKKIFDAGMAPAWNGQTGISISGGKAVPLPDALGTEAFLQNFLRRCRELAAAE